MLRLNDRADVERLRIVLDATEILPRERSTVSRAADRSNRRVTPAHMGSVPGPCPRSSKHPFSLLSREFRRRPRRKAHFRLIRIRGRVSARLQIANLDGRSVATSSASELNRERPSCSHSGNSCRLLENVGSDRDSPVCRGRGLASLQATFGADARRPVLSERQDGTRPSA
jgi:hypothetical protein